MFSSMIGLAMTVVLSSSASLPVWQMDYRMAREFAVREHKPLAVIIGTGSAGWEKVVPMADNTVSVMRSEFVCVYVDKTTPEGEKLARAFDMADTTGVVISDRNVDLQAFRQTGTIAEAEMQRVAQRYADPKHVVSVTESLVTPIQVQPIRSNCPQCQAQAYRQQQLQQQQK